MEWPSYSINTLFSYKKKFRALEVYQMFGFVKCPTLFYCWVLFNPGKLFPPTARVLIGHMTSSNETLSWQNLRRQRLTVYFYQQRLTARWIYFHKFVQENVFSRELVSYKRLVSRETVNFVSLRTGQLVFNIYPKPFPYISDIFPFFPYFLFPDTTFGDRWTNRNIIRRWEVDTNVKLI